MSETLKTALREACAEIRAHNMHAAHITMATRIQEWERLANEPEPKAVRGFDRLQASHVAPSHLPSVVPVSPATSMLLPGDESPPRPCCRRIVDWWCVLPDSHPGPHDAPAPRALPAVDFGPRAATTTRRG